MADARHDAGPEERRTRLTSLTALLTEKWDQKSFVDEALRWKKDVVRYEALRKVPLDEEVKKAVILCNVVDRCISEYC